MNLVMKNIKYIISSIIVSLLILSCYNDKGNYDYLTEEEVGVIKIDTIGIDNRLVLRQRLTPGQHIEFEPNVTYKNLERLRYRWFVLPMINGEYRPVQVGNALVYPPADTIAYTKKLDWVVDLAPGTYRFYMMAEDSINGQRAYYQAQEVYTTVEASGIQSGLYLLSEYNGETDIDVYTSDLMLIVGKDSQKFRYYSETTGRTIPGKPRFIKGTHTGSVVKDGYLVFTDEVMYRLNSVGLQFMNDWNSSFYDVPSVFNPQQHFFINNADFLVNDGKLYVLYTNQSNDRKFSAAISGEYNASGWLAHKTKAEWGAVSGAIAADQIIFDSDNLRFRPYYTYGSSISGFKSTVGGAYLDANKLPAHPIAIFNGYGEKTYAIVKEENTHYLYRFNFYNRVDNGDLSSDGIRSKLDLSGCKDISEAKLFASNNAGHAFYYATNDAVYSFSPQSGQTDSYTVYTCEPNEEVTAIYSWNSSGWPTAGYILWVAVWDNVKGEGKLIEYEVDPDAGKPMWMWGEFFAPTHSNPYITTGYGKIKSMVQLEAE